MTPVNELINFLAKSAPTEAKNQALAYIAGLPDSEDGRSLLLKNSDLVKAVALLVQDENTETASRACKCLTNFTSVPAISEHLVEHDYGGLLAHLVDRSLRSESHDSVARQCAATLSNLTRGRQGAEKAWTLLNSTNKCDDLLAALCSSINENHDHLSFVFSNLSQLDEVRRWLLDQAARRIHKFFPFLTLETSTIRKHGAAAVLRNCCFETESNEWLLSPDVDILSRLLYPLMGPEELDDDEMEKLPLDLQYLGNDKQREGSPEIRQMLIEAITQLCATKKCREHIKNSGAYYVLRELHKTESCRPVVVACENLVDILISDEPEPGMENLKDVDIPEHLVKKFEAFNEELLKE
ncbi:protein HGH1 homolog [Dermacentor silvarum]|uniref:protein HGH1 homolog n=1 Tax=Dermacentor silvarum TaxID=543639 RepID=UPI00189AC85F|nr:protein HGH1 homolog [Dermacentor silvarum]